MQKSLSHRLRRGDIQFTQPTLVLMDFSHLAALQLLAENAKIQMKQLVLVEVLVLGIPGNPQQRLARIWRVSVYLGLWPALSSWLVFGGERGTEFRVAGPEDALFRI